ncbi:MAG: queuosine precursor transporter [Desulfurococcales archaeon]|nr:queuosine precursor transporter [Desulfurococcales archaeon]
MDRLSDRDLMVLLILSGMFGAALVYANISAGIKFIQILWFVVPAGTIAYAITFTITDVVDEIYGRKGALFIVWGGLAAELVMLLLIGVDKLLPPAAIPNAPPPSLYDQVFTPQFRIVAASIIAYLVSQHHDVWAFLKLKELTGGRHLWIRNNASTIVSQLIDSAIFITLAFGSLDAIGATVNMIVSMWLAKVLIAALDTPLVYAGVSLVSRFTGRLGAGGRVTTTLPPPVNGSS